MKILITGGAGFIGSHLTEELSKKHQVFVFDDFSSGRKEFLKDINCQVIEGSILKPEEISKAMKGIEECYHLAADPSVKESYNKPIKNFELDCRGTLNVLEACRKNSVNKLIFTSSSVVYGLAEMPTPEKYPIKPISNYGAAKASSENYIMSYSHLYGITGVILRYANIIGPKSTHGICFDFYKKLKKDKNKLKILGDGTQEKSYLHVKDTVDATLFAKDKIHSDFGVFNVGSEETITVNEIAKTVIDAVELKDVEFEYTGGKSGWPGDVPKMLLSIEKLKKLGWNPKYSIRESIRDTIGYLKKEVVV